MASKDLSLSDPPPLGLIDFRQRRTFDLGDSGVCCFRKEGNIIVSLRSDLSGEIIETNSLRTLRTIPLPDGHAGEAFRICDISPDGEWILSGYCNLWHVSDPNARQGYLGKFGAFSSDGSFIIAWDEVELRVFRLHDIINSFVPRPLHVIPNDAGTLKFDTSITRNQLLIIDKHVAQVFDMASLDELARFPDTKRASFSADGNFVFTISKSWRTCDVWKLGIEFPIQQFSLVTDRGNRAMGFPEISPRGRYVFGNYVPPFLARLRGYDPNGCVQLREAESGRISCEILPSLDSLTISPDERILAGSVPAPNGKIRLYLASSGVLLAECDPHEQCTTSIAFSPNSKNVLSRGYTGDIVRTRRATLYQLATLS